MQAWELERELGKAQDKLKALKTWAHKYLIWDSSKVLWVGEFWEILEDSHSCSESEPE